MLARDNRTRGFDNFVALESHSSETQLSQGTASTGCRLTPATTGSVMANCSEATYGGGQTLGRQIGRMSERCHERQRVTDEGMKIEGIAE